MPVWNLALHIRSWVFWSFWSFWYAFCWSISFSEGFKASGATVYFSFWKRVWLSYPSQEESWSLPARKVGPLVRASFSRWQDVSKWADGGDKTCWISVFSLSVLSFFCLFFRIWWDSKMHAQSLLTTLLSCWIVKSVVRKLKTKTC